MRKARKTKGPLTTNRRTFVKAVGLAGAGMLLPIKGLVPRAMAALPGGTLDPLKIPKYRTPLFQIPPMPMSGVVNDKDLGPIDYYEVAARQFRQQILPPGLPQTTVWGYGSLAAPGTVANKGSFSYPAFTFETQYGRQVRVKWVNDLKDPQTGAYLPPLLPVDQTLHWANPPGPRDTHTYDPSLYTGPVPTVPHLHGGHTDEDSDGYPEAWFLPNANNIPQGYLREGTWYEYFKDQFYNRTGVVWQAGTSVLQYNNDQSATALWYHDHSLGLTRTNVYAGLAGFYMVRGGSGDLPSGVLPGETGRSPYEIPLLIQDRAFNADGSLFYPNSRLFFDGFAGPYVPNSDIPPIWNAEFFGNTMVVNGRTWPYLDVEARRYRFRILNGCNSRFLMLQLSNGMPFARIGADGSFLPEVVMQDRLLLAPSERADVILDFTKLKTGTQIILLNVAPDEPFGGGLPGQDFLPADPDTTGQVMLFRVRAASSIDNTTPVEKLVLPTPADLGQPIGKRQISFNELDSAVLPGVGPLIGLLGQVKFKGPISPYGVPLHWDDDVTETPAVGTTEIWEIFDFTEDAHPFHVHLVEFEVLNREVFDPLSPNYGQVRGPDAGETGRKDTLIVYPGEVTRIKVHFDIAGRYVWHCHILEHEDNEMMRPYQIVNPRKR